MINYHYIQTYRLIYKLSHFCFDPRRRYLIPEKTNVVGGVYEGLINVNQLTFIKPLQHFLISIDTCCTNKVGLRDLEKKSVSA